MSQLRFCLRQELHWALECLFCKQFPLPVVTYNVMTGLESFPMLCEISPLYDNDIVLAYSLNNSVSGRNSFFPPSNWFFRPMSFNNMYERKGEGKESFQFLLRRQSCSHWLCITQKAWTYHSFFTFSSHRTPSSVPILTPFVRRVVQCARVMFV